MEAEHRDLRAHVDTKADRKEVVFRHEIDSIITRVCTSIIDRRMKQLEDEYAEFKGLTIRRLNKVEEEIPPLRNKLAMAQDQINKQGTKIGNLQTRLLKAEAEIPEKCEQSEMDALVKSVKINFHKANEALENHNGRIIALVEALRVTDTELRQKLAETETELREVAATIPEQESVESLEALVAVINTKHAKLTESIAVMKKAYLASDASLPLKAQLELFLQE